MKINTNSANIENTAATRRAERLNKVKELKKNNDETNMDFLACLFQKMNINYAYVASKMPRFITAEAIGYWFRIDDCRYSLLRAVMNNLGIAINYQFEDADGNIYPIPRKKPETEKTFKINIDPELNELFHNETIQTEKQNSHDLLTNNDLTEESNTYNMIATIRDLNYMNLKDFVEKKGRRSYFAYYRTFTSDEIKISALREFANSLNLSIIWNFRKMTEEETKRWKKKRMEFEKELTEK